MEKIEVIGNLTRDPEVRDTRNGKKYCVFTVAANSYVPVYNQDGGKGSRKITNFYRITVWGAQVETCHQYLKKGRKVRVYGTFAVEFARDQSGALLFRNNPDGTKSDEPLLNLNITAKDDVEFLSNINSDNEGNDQATPSGSQNTATAQPAQPASGMTEVNVDDELPF